MEFQWHFLLLVIASTAFATNTDVALCRYYESRKEMDCSNLNLGKLKGKKFPLNNTDTTVVNLRNTKLRELSFDAFFCLQNLEYLSLAKNILAVLDERVFSYVKSLVGLDLSENRLTYLPGHLFRNLTELKKLYLCSNMITYLKDKGTFITQNKLRFLTLKNNRITTIRAEVLKPLSSLNRLELSGNPLSCDCELKVSMLWCKQMCLDTGAICQHPSEYNGQLWTHLNDENCSYPNDRLSELGIKNNNENTYKCRENKCFYESEFVSMDCESVILGEVHAGEYPLNNKKLQSIGLRDTHLKEIAADTFNEFLELYEIDLGENMLENIEPNLFAELRNLKILYIDSNKLVSLNDKAIFASQSNLEILYLSHNKLNFISEDVLQPLISLNILSLEENDFICNCALRPAVIWCNNKNILTGATCNSPNDLSDLSWNILRNTTDECTVQGSDTLLIVIAIFIILILASCVIIAFWFLWKRRRLNATGNQTVLIYDDVKQSDYYYETIEEADGRVLPDIPSRPLNLPKQSQILKEGGAPTVIYDDVRNVPCSNRSTAYILPDNPVHKS